jgi:multidrug resistance efflux pump
MVTKFILPLLSVLGLSFAVGSVLRPRPPQAAVPISAPPRRPAEFKSIAGSGLIEARRENIPIGSPVPGVVWEVFVKIGDRVKVGDPLFRLDDREVQPQIKVRQASLAAARAQLHRALAAPRAEDLPPARAAVEEAKAKLNDAESAMARTEKLYVRQMAPASDYDHDRFAYYSARAALARAVADLDKITAGSWKEDIEVARASVQMAESELESSQVLLDRLTVRALAEGEVLQVNVRPGQFAALAWREPMIVLGDVNRLHVRVDIDENDLPMFAPHAPAFATLKGRTDVRFPLEFVKVEPYVIPKKSLTGDSSERVDTRVLQVIYALPDERAIQVYVGQQMDVYLREAASKPTNVARSASAARAG